MLFILCFSQAYLLCINNMPKNAGIPAKVSENSLEKVKTEGTLHS